MSDRSQFLKDVATALVVMVKVMGAPIAPEDQARIQDYLVEQYGKK